MVGPNPKLHKHVVLTDWMFSPVDRPMEPSVMPQLGLKYELLKIHLNKIRPQRVGFFMDKPSPKPPKASTEEISSFFWFVRIG